MDNDYDFDAPGSTQRSLMMKVESAIYEPPKPEFPHLVVTLTPNGMNVHTAVDRTEARTIISRLTRRKAQKDEKNGTLSTGQG